MSKTEVLKAIRLICTFYKGFLLPCFFITACCLYLFWEYGFSIFREIIWLKAITLLIIFYFINSYKKKEYYYYQNLGISKGILWSTTLIFDFSIFLFFIIQIYKFR